MNEPDIVINAKSAHDAVIYLMPAHVGTVEVYDAAGTLLVRITPNKIEVCETTGREVKPLTFG